MGVLDWSERYRSKESCLKNPGNIKINIEIANGVKFNTKFAAVY